MSKLNKVDRLKKEYKEYKKIILRVVGKGHSVTYKEWLEFQVIKLRKLQCVLCLQGTTSGRLHIGDKANTLKEKEAFLRKKLSSVEGLNKLGEALGREFRNRKEQIAKERLIKGVDNGFHIFSRRKHGKG